MVWRKRGLVSSSFSFDPSAGVVKRVAGVGGGSCSSGSFFSIFMTLRNRKEFSQTLAITTKVCQSHTSLSWHRGFATNKLSRSISLSPPSGLDSTEGRGCGEGCTHLRGQRGGLSEHCRAPQDGLTPLLVAALQGHAAVVEQLLAAGVNTEAKRTVSWERGGGCEMRM